MLVLTGLTHFGQKLIKSTNEKIQVCARKQAQFWIFKLQLATYRTDTEKNRQIAKEMGEKKEKEKKNRSGRCYAFTRKRKRLEGFLKTSIF